MTGEGQDLLSGLHVPDHRLGVLGGGGQQLAIGAEGQAVDRLAVAPREGVPLGVAEAPQVTPLEATQVLLAGLGPVALPQGQQPLHVVGPPGGVREWHVHDAGFYYDRLAPQAVTLDFWETEYAHVMDGAEQILEWYKGSGLRPYFAALSSADDRDAFAADYLKTIRAAYPRRADGRILFSFRRLFLIAYR